MKTRKYFLLPVLMMSAVLLLSCSEKKSNLEQPSDEWKKVREEVKFFIEMPDLSDTYGSFSLSVIRQTEDRGYRYTLMSQDDDLEKTVGEYVFSVFGNDYANSDFKNAVYIQITKKPCHENSHWYHHGYPLNVEERVRFISMLTAFCGSKPQEIWIDEEVVNFDYWWTHGERFAENYLAQNLFWQLEDRKIFIRKDSVKFVISIFLQ